MQRLGARIARLRADDCEVATGGDVVELEHLVVAVLVVRVADDRGANVRVVAIEARRAAADPARAFDDLRPQVQQQSLVVRSR